MKEIILIKYGELALKGLNRATFEDAMIRSLKRALQPYGGFEIHKSQSTVTAEPLSDPDMDEVCDAVSKVFGIAAFSRAAVCEKDMDVILATAEEYMKDKMADAATFKVEARRADKKFPLGSPEICAVAGERLLQAFPGLRVDVHHPDVTVNIEVSEKYAYIHAAQIKGAGGMPCGTAGKAAVLISGGIDSPVAAYLMAKRGVMLTAVHFASPPYTSAQAEEKVKHLLSEVAVYSGTIKLYVVPFTKIQEAIRDDCPEEYFTLIMRRMMMRIAQNIANDQGCRALITGESLGQVASQTLPAICSTDSVINMPVLRPLIAFDKTDIIEISRAIGTFDTSIEPFEDCCTVFTPKHPRTNPSLENVEKAESRKDFSELIKAAADGAQISFFNGDYHG